MIVSFEPDRVAFSAIQQRLKDVGKGGMVNQVLRNAVNETAAEVKNKAYAETKERYTIKSTALKKSNIGFKQATQKKPEAVISVKGKVLPIYGAYKTLKNQGPAGAQTMILKSGMMKKLEFTEGGRTYKAFYAKMKSGHEGIFQRVPNSEKDRKPKRQSIKEITSIARSKAVEKAYETKVKDTVNAEITFRLLKCMNAVIGA